MPGYVLSKEAAQDLKEIARYTLRQWGESAFSKYQKGLANKMNAIGRGEAVARQFSASYPQLRVSKYRYHYIFYLDQQTDKPADKPVVIGVIHEKRDIVNRLKNRLD